MPTCMCMGDQSCGMTLYMYDVGCVGFDPLCTLPVLCTMEEWMITV